jgi:hypothetical protein
LPWHWLTAPILYSSMTINWLCGGPFHETASARIAYARQHHNKSAAITCGVFNVIDVRVSLGSLKDHCDRAILDDKRRRHLD